MNNTLHKKEIIDGISEKLINERIVIGGNKSFYQRKYHLKYTKKIIAKVIDAFWDVIAEAVEDGDSIKMNSYIKIEPKYYKAVKLNAEGLKWVKENVVPARYRIRFTMGERLKESCRRLSDKKLNNENSDIDL